MHVTYEASHKSGSKGEQDLGYWIFLHGIFLQVLALDIGFSSGPHLEFGKLIVQRLLIENCDIEKRKNKSSEHLTLT